MAHASTDREYLNIVYRTDPDVLREVVPEPLNEVIGFGPYTKSGQAIPVRLGDERGEYLHGIYLDNFPAIAFGRELSAYPKSVGAPRRFVDQGALDIGTLRVATATMGYKHRCLDLNDARAQITLPTFMR